MDLSIIIVSYNTKALLKQLLNSMTLASPKYEIIIVDNNSEDGSVEFLRESFKDVHIIENSRNIGFGKANNLGAAIARGQYLLFLNSDTLLSHNAIERMRKSFEKDNRVEIVGPKLLNKNGTLQRSCGIFPNLLTEFSGRTFLNRLFPRNKIFGAYKFGNWDYSMERKVDWVSGACLMIGKEAFDRVGGFDENIFMFYEDVDLCYRSKQMGYEVLFTPEAEIYHLHGGSWLNHRETPVLNSSKSAFYFFRKHYGWGQTQVLRLFLLVEVSIGYMVLLPYLFLKGEKYTDLQSRARGYNRCLKYLLTGVN